MTIGDDGRSYYYSNIELIIYNTSIQILSKRTLVLVSTCSRCLPWNSWFSRRQQRKREMQYSIPHSPGWQRMSPWVTRQGTLQMVKRIWLSKLISSSALFFFKTIFIVIVSLSKKADNRSTEHDNGPEVMLMNHTHYFLFWSFSNKNSLFYFEIKMHKTLPVMIYGIIHLCIPPTGPRDSKFSHPIMFH